MHNIWDNNLHHNSFDSDCKQFWCKLVVSFYGTAVNWSIKCWLVVTWMHDDSGNLGDYDQYIFFMAFSLAAIWRPFLKCSSLGCYVKNVSRGGALKKVSKNVENTPKKSGVYPSYTNTIQAPQKFVSIGLAAKIHLKDDKIYLEAFV